MSLNVTAVMLPGWGYVEGIDEPTPTISWGLSGTEQATHVRVQLSSGYDSGKVTYVPSVELPRLAALSTYTATVTVWAGATSATGALVFSTGPMAQADWGRAQWVTVPGTPAPMLRSVVTCTAGDLLLDVAAQGSVAVWVDGVRVSGCSDPGFPEYTVRALFRTYRVTVTAGDHVVAVMLGRAWKGCKATTDWGWATAPWAGDPQVMIRARGAASMRTGDTSWKACPAGSAPTLNACNYYGELFDFRKAQTGWATAGFDTTAWVTPTVVADPGTAVTAYRCYPETYGTLISPTTTSTPTAGVWLYDFGKITSGTARVTVTGLAAGTRVAIGHAERLASGRAYLDNNAVSASNVAGTAATVNTDVFYSAGGTETFEAVLTFKSTRYVEVTFPDGGAAAPTTVQLRPIVSTVPARASFTCNETVLTALFAAAQWTMTINQHAGVMSDCIGREKLGWVGDVNATLPASQLLLDMDPTIRQHHTAMVDSLRATGWANVVAPAPPYYRGFSKAPEWTSAHVLVAWRMWKMTGDLTWVAQTFERCRSALDWMYANKAGSVWDSDYGDWASPAGNGNDGGKDSTATYHVIIAMKALAEMATALGQTALATLWSGRAATEQTAWAARLYDGSWNGGAYKPATTYVGSEFKTTPTILAYELGVEPAAHGTAPIAAVASKFTTDGVFNNGIIGQPPLLKVLSENGQMAAAMTILRATAKPSWGLFTQYAGYGTLWGALDYPGSNASLSHHMHGSFARWMITHLAGIRPTGPGAVTVTPSYQTTTCTASLNLAGAGTITVTWDATTLTITVPPGVAVTYNSTVLNPGVNSYSR